MQPWFVHFFIWILKGIHVDSTRFILSFCDTNDWKIGSCFLLFVIESFACNFVENHMGALHRRIPLEWAKNSNSGSRKRSSLWKRCHYDTEIRKQIRFPASNPLIFYHIYRNILLVGLCLQHEETQNSITLLSPPLLFPPRPPVSSVSALFDDSSSVFTSGLDTRNVCSLHPLSI